MGDVPLCIRPVELARDSSAVLELYRQTAEWHARTWPHDLRTPDLDRLADELAAGSTDENATMLVADVDGEVAGLVTGSVREPPAGGMNRYDGPVCWIGDIVVDPSHRGHGVAGELMRAIEAWAAARGAVTVELMMHVHNEAAERLYHTGGYRQVHVQLRKDLTAPPG